MLPYRDSIITRIALIVFFLLVLGYAYFEAQGLLFGPSITAGTPGMVVHDPFIKIQGKADRIASLSLNGKQITVTEDGAFSEPYLLVEGDNRIVLDARDTYGRTTRKIMDIVYVPDAATSPETTATSTVSASTTPVAQ